MSTLSITLFKSASDNNPQLFEMDTFAKFVEFLKVPRKPSWVPHGDDPKKGMPAFSPSIFKPGTPRAVANVISINLLCLDVDNAESIPTGEYYLDKEGNSTGRAKMKKVCIKDPVRISDLEGVLQRAGVDHFIHPTWSDKPDWPHIRVIIPLAQPIPPEKWDFATAWTIRHLGLEPFMRGVDLPVLKDVARIYFLPGGPNVR
ncbi:MAG: hypothetical protein IPN59_09190 [Holophaga sp.]|nr:hypothetical protein [Holophaga sp.]